MGSRKMKLLIVASIISIIAFGEAHHLEHHQGQRNKANIQASGFNKTETPLPKCSQAICAQPTDPFRDFPDDFKGSTFQWYGPIDKSLVYAYKIWNARDNKSSYFNRDLKCTSEIKISYYEQIGQLKNNEIVLVYYVLVYHECVGLGFPCGLQRTINGNCIAKGRSENFITVDQ